MEKMTGIGGLFFRGETTSSPSPLYFFTNPS